MEAFFLLIFQKVLFKLLKNHRLFTIFSLPFHSGNNFCYFVCDLSKR